MRYCPSGRHQEYQELRSAIHTIHALDILHCHAQGDGAGGANATVLGASEAWMASHWRWVSPDYGTDAKRPASPSKPELKRKGRMRAEGRRASAVWSWLYKMRRELPEPKMAADEWRAAMTRERRNKEFEKERYSLEMSTGATIAMGDWSQWWWPHRWW